MKMVTPEEFRIQAQGDFSRQKIATVYEEYEKQMRANNALDFDDLLVKAVQLFQTQADVSRLLSGAVPLYHGG